jgi:predicted transcriptional regulator
MVKSSFRPTSSELEILQVLWEQGPSSVRQVNEVLATHREVGYTTTLKLMQIMLDKGLLERDETFRTHIYKPAVSKQIVQGQLVRRFVDSAFQGSASKLVMQILGNHQASKEELDAIKELIEKIEKERGI